MRPLQFSWDDAKERDNQKKHGVSFNEAKTVFYDDNGRIAHDPEHSEEEEDRFILLGFSESLRMLVVCHCYREREGMIRIITARKATRREQKNYLETK